MRSSLASLTVLVLSFPVAPIQAQVRVLCATTQRNTAWVNCFLPEARRALAAGNELVVPLRRTTTDPDGRFDLRGVPDYPGAVERVRLAGFDLAIVALTDRPGPIEVRLER